MICVLSLIFLSENALKMSLRLVLSCNMDCFLFSVSSPLDEHPIQISWVGRGGGGKNLLRL